MRRWADTDTGRRVLKLIHGVAERGGSVVMVTHDLQAASTADTVVTLRDGRVLAQLESPSPERILQALEQDAAR